MREKRFWNIMAKKYSKDPIKNMEWYNHTLDITKDFLNKKQKVLEIGCGTGSTASKLAPYVKEYIATDISTKMIEIGKEKTKDMKNITFFDATLFDKRLKKGSYDVIFAYNLIHLLDDRDKAMKRINELLKPGGLFISKTACLGEKRIMFVLASLLTPIIGPIRCFTLIAYKESLDKAGFKIVKEHVYKEDPPRLLCVAKKK